LRCTSVRFLSISIYKAPADYTATPLQKRLLRLRRLRAVIAPRRRAAFAYKRYGELICKIVDVKTPSRTSARNGLRVIAKSAGHTGPAA
jgi:hypothetical protein